MVDMNETIVAVSSAPGHAARGIIRISGPDAIAGADRVFRTGKNGDLSQTPGWTFLQGTCRLTDGFNCEAMALIFRQKHSYTTQDMVELHLPGAPALLEMVMKSLLQNGIRLAEPGEFTARAFFGGRIDLTEAEAVAELINARNDAQLRAAERLMEGGLYQHCRDISGELAEILASVEADIDFCEEDIEIASRPELLRLTQSVLVKLDNILAASVSWKQLYYLPEVVLCGQPNSGKSSLLNAILGYSRSVVSVMAGATRDLLKVPTSMPHGECLLVDSAGIGVTSDPLGDKAQYLTQQAMANADLVLLVMDFSDENQSHETVYDMISPKIKLIRVGNKVDLLNKETIAARRPQVDIFVSALYGNGLDELKALIDVALHQRDDSSGRDDLMALTSRQMQALQDAAGNIRAAAEFLTSNSGGNTELIALELREALDKIGQISGEFVTEDVLGIIFQRFCVGK